MKMKINQEAWDNDMKIIWDELFSYEYENEFDYWDADILLFKYESLIYGMEFEYYEL